MSEVDAPLSARPPPRSERVLVAYMRLLGLVFLLGGAWYWASILGIAGFEALDAMPRLRQAATIAFAVATMVAGVGLWFASSWGVVVWLVVALAQIVTHVAFRDLFGTNWELVGAHLGAMIVYMLIAWRVASISEE